MATSPAPKARPALVITTSGTRIAIQPSSVSAVERSGRRKAARAASSPVRSERGRREREAMPSRLAALARILGRDDPCTGGRRTRPGGGASTPGGGRRWAGRKVRQRPGPAVYSRVLLVVERSIAALRRRRRGDRPEGAGRPAGCWTHPPRRGGSAGGGHGSGGARGGAARRQCPRRRAGRARHGGRPGQDAVLVGGRGERLDDDAAAVGRGLAPARGGRVAGGGRAARGRRRLRRGLPARARGGLARARAGRGPLRDRARRRGQARRPPNAAGWRGRRGGEPPCPAPNPPPRAPGPEPP